MPSSALDLGIQPRGHLSTNGFSRRLAHDETDSLSASPDAEPVVRITTPAYQYNYATDGDRRHRL